MWPVGLALTQRGGPGSACQHDQPGHGERTKLEIPLTRSRDTVRFLRGIVKQNVLDLSLMHLVASLLNVASTPDHLLTLTLQHH